MKKQIKRICALFLCGLTILLTMPLFPVKKIRAESGNIYDEHPVTDVEFWTQYYKENPEMADRFRFRGGYGRYTYDRFDKKMVKSAGWGGYTDISEPIDYSVYDENGDLKESVNFWPIIPNPPKLYFDAIPMDYLNKYWVLNGPENGTDVKTISIWHEDEPEYAGDRFRSQSDSDNPILADWQLQGRDAVHYGEKYNGISFYVAYMYDIRIVSKDFWPIENVEKTCIVPENVKTTLEEEIRERESQEGTWDINDPYSEEIIGQETYTYYETILAGKRTFVRENNARRSFTTYNDECGHTGLGENNYYSYKSFTETTGFVERDYYVIEDLEELPGFYYCIHIYVKDFFGESVEVNGEGQVRPEAEEIINEYNRLKPLVTEQLVNELAALKPGISFTPVSENGNYVNQNETVHAREEEGEDEGTNVINEIVDGVDMDDIAKGVGAGVVALGAVGLAGMGGKEGGGKDDKKKGKKKKSSYRMYVQKDFGNAIKKGADPVKVRARIVEVDEKGERDRSDLTAKITAFSQDGLIISNTAKVGRYMEATVSAPKDFQSKNGSITFQLIGEGGSFSQKVVFRITGEPYIVFPSLSEDGTTWNVNANLNTISMVAGMGGQESLRFLIQDAVEEPVKITFQNTDGFQIVPAKDTGLAFTYYAQITNRTEKMAKEGNIFFRKEEHEITVSAGFYDGTEIHETFTIELYPDGLSVEAINPKQVINERLLIDTEPDPNPGPGYSKIKPVGFKVMVCFVDAEGKAVILSNPTIHFEKLEDEGKYQETFNGQFKYTVSRAGSAGFDFMPESTLPMIKDPYEVTMRINFIKEADKRFPCEGILPISFLGFKPLPPSQAKHAEAVKRLKDTVKKYGLSGGDPFLSRMIQNSDFYSASEIEFTRYQVILAAKLYYESEGREYQAIANVFDRYVVVAGGLITAGDYAIEVILSKCLGSAGKTAAKFINPLKNMLATTIGEYIANGTEFSEEEFWKAYRSGIYDAIEQALSDVKPNSDKIAYVPAAYLLLMFVKHYYDGKGKEKGDVYRSLIAAFYDLKFAQLKEWIGDYVSKGAGKLWDKVQEWFTNIFKLRFVSSMVKTMESAGMKAFTDQVRAAYKSGGTLTRDQYEKAKRARVFAEIMQGEQASAMISRGASQFGEKGKEITKIGLAQVVNYFIGGKNNGEEGYGASPEDVIQEFLFDKLSDNLEKGIEYTEDFFEKALPGIYISGSVMTVTCFDESYEVNLAEMAQKIIDAMFDYCFSWMDDMWKTVMPDMNSLPDKRDEMSDDTSLLDQQQARLDNAKC